MGGLSGIETELAVEPKTPTGEAPMLTLLALAAMPIGLSLIVHALPGAAGDDSPMAREQRRIFEESLR